MNQFDTIGMFFPFHHNTFITRFLRIRTTTTNWFACLNAQLLFGFFLFLRKRAKTTKRRGRERNGWKTWTWERKQKHRALTKLTGIGTDCPCPIVSDCLVSSFLCEMQLGVWSCQSCCRRRDNMRWFLRKCSFLRVKVRRRSVNSSSRSQSHIL